MQLAYKRTLSIALLIFSAGPIAALALPFLSSRGLIADTPVPVLIGLLVMCSLANALVLLLERRLPAPTGLQVRTAVAAASTGWFVYATGWGSLLVIGYAIGIAEAVRVYGSHAWKSGLAWAAAVIVIGEVLVSFDIAPTVISPSMAHAVAIATFGCLALLARTFGGSASDAERAAAALEASRAYFHDLVSHSEDVIVLVDQHLVILYMSPGILPLLGRAAEECVGRDAAEVFGAEPRNDIAGSSQVLEHCEDVNFEWPLMDASGGARWVRARATRRADGSLVLNLRDVTDQRELEAKLELRARNDVLTGLANRAALTELLAGLPPHERITLLFIDLDGFKKINDSLGHKRGDVVLRDVAQCIAAQVPPDVTVGRLGGDEFLAVLPHANPADAQALATRIIAAIEGLGTQLPGSKLSASIGIAAGSPGDAPERLLHRADQAMYQAKETGPGQFVVRVSN